MEEFDYEGYREELQRIVNSDEYQETLKRTQKAMEEIAEAITNISKKIVETFNTIEWESLFKDLKEAPVRNIDRIKAMNAEQLAGFLAESGAPVPTEFCDILCTEDCMICPFVGPNGNKKAWKIWLESEYDGEEKEDGQEPQEPEKVQADEQGTSEQERKTEEDAEQGSERSDGSGPADRREL